MIIIRLKKVSKDQALHYAIVVTASHTAVLCNKFLEKIGFYKPLTDKWSNKYIFVDVDRLLFWLSRGAKMNPSVFLLVKSLLLKISLTKNIKKKILWR